MATRETPLVVISLMGVICTDVFAVIFAQLLDGLFDVPVIRLRGVLLKALQHFKNTNYANVHDCKQSLSFNNCLIQIEFFLEFPSFAT